MMPLSLIEILVSALPSDVGCGYARFVPADMGRLVPFVDRNAVHCDRNPAMQRDGPQPASFTSTRPALRGEHLLRALAWVLADSSHRDVPFAVRTLL